jgi:hypothetical protein
MSQTKPGGMKRKKRLSLGITLLVVACIFTWSVGDLLVVPGEVKWTRRQYSLLLKSYREDRGGWDAQRRDLIGSLGGRGVSLPVAAHDIPLEIILSYLVDHLGFAEGEFKGVALYPSQDPSSLSFYLSKYESHLWPFRVLLSLEAKLEYVDGRWDVKFLHFRRGRRELPTGLAWIYLGAELQRLRTFESFSDLAPGMALGQNETRSLSLRW